MATSSLILNTALASDLDVIGDRWVLLILRDVFLGRNRFESLKSQTGASRATLTRRLDTLLAADILYKHPYSPSGNRFEYKLTKKGLALFNGSMLAWHWERTWADEDGSPLPSGLRHTTCESEFIPKTVCRHCGMTLALEDVQWPQANTDLKEQIHTINSMHKQRRVRVSQGAGEDMALSTISDLVGDRWTLLLLISSYLGIKRYDGFVNQLNIASNILSHRLKLLVEKEIFTKEIYQQQPIRYEYLLTQKGKSLYPLIMVLRQWALKYQPIEESLIHKTCGKPLVITVNCQECGSSPNPYDVKVFSS